MVYSVRYGFTQRFEVLAQKAYQWCTTYDPTDHVLMGDKDGKRSINRVADSTIILTDTFPDGKGGAVTKKKLVELYPETLSYNATHLTGPLKYSQFSYVITADGAEASHLDFRGLYLDYEDKNLDEAAITRIANQLCKDDAAAWKLLAKAMAKDFGK